MNIYRLAGPKRYTWRDIYRFPIALMLAPLVMRDYWLRKRRRRPDRWYWADVIMINMGYALMTWHIRLWRRK